MLSCSAFGLDITSALPLPGVWRCQDLGLPSLRIQPASHDDIDAEWSGADRLGWRGLVDGRDLVAEHGVAGDLRLRVGPAIDMHVSADGLRLLVADADG